MTLQRRTADDAGDDETARDPRPAADRTGASGPSGAHGPAERALRLARSLMLGGFALYAVFAPHSIAGAWIALSLAALGWLVGALLQRRTGFVRSRLDLPLWLLFGWSVLSSLFSAEPRVSLAKLLSLSPFFIFYLAQAALTRRTAIMLALLLIASGVAGVLWSTAEIVRGRGVRVEEIAEGSPFLRLETPLSPGDAVWRVGGRRVFSVAEIDAALRAAPAGAPVSVSVISRGEHVEWTLPPIAEETRRAASPSGLRGDGPTHRFRASGWTRHYETHAELLQMLAQLALGFALAALQRGASRRRVVLAASAFVLLAGGIALTAMRTVLVAFAVGALVVAWRATAQRKTRLVVLLAVVVGLALGAFVVGRTRATGALMLRDASAALRLSVARHAAERTLVHPIFGHGMDAYKFHWQEWGFPGTVQIHTHSTPIQLAFERGLPALLFWLWLVAAALLETARTERNWRASEDDATHGLLLGLMGALAGFFASSLVNYNFGDAEVALLFFCLTGALVRIGREAV